MSFKPVSLGRGYDLRSKPEPSIVFAYRFNVSDSLARRFTVTSQPNPYPPYCNPTPMKNKVNATTRTKLESKTSSSYTDTRSPETRTNATPIAMAVCGRQLWEVGLEKNSGPRHLDPGRHFFCP